MANNKKIIWIGIASVLLIGGGTFLWWKNKKAKDEEEQRKQEEEAKKTEEENKPDAPRVIQLPSTPFTNTIEGNKFRAWVNKTYPTYAKQIDLSLSGASNNSIIRKAYQQYSAEYTASLSKTTTTSPSSSTFRSGSPVYLRSGINSSAIYSYPEFKGDYVIGSADKATILDRAFAKFISNTGKGFLKVETIAFTPRCKPNERCMAVPQPMKKIAFVAEKLVSTKPY